MPDKKPLAKDDADIASEQEEHFREEALWRVKHTGPQRLMGSCYNCGDPCQGLFCDTACQADYERRRALQQRTHAQQADGETRQRVRRAILTLKRKPWNDPMTNERQQPAPREQESERRGEYDAFTQRTTKWKD